MQEHMWYEELPNNFCVILNAIPSSVLFLVILYIHFLSHCSPLHEQFFIQLLILALRGNSLSPVSSTNLVLWNPSVSPQWAFIFATLVNLGPSKPLPFCSFPVHLSRHQVMQTSTQIPLRHSQIIWFHFRTIWNLSRYWIFNEFSSLGHF